MAKKKTEEVDLSKQQYELAMDKLNKSYGKGTVFKLGSKKREDYDVISTGSIGFDYIALGVGGFVKGKLYELMGWEGTGKSTICGHLAANCQAQGGRVAYIDGEHAVDTNYFEALGVDLNNLIFAQPSNGEEGFQIVEELLKSKDVDLIIIDSDSSLIPKAAIEEGEVGDSTIGKKARLNNNAYPRLKNLIVRAHACVVVISQFREKIGVMFGNPTTTQGGHALKFYSDCRAEISKSVAKHGDDAYGNLTKIKTIKNKTFSPYRIAKFDIVWGMGIDQYQEVIDLGIEFGVLTKYGKTISYGETKFDKEVLQDNPEFFEEIKAQLITKIKNDGVSVEHIDIPASEEASGAM